jgi:hypothetical protein
VIIGKLIPAGTGMVRYRSVTPVPTEVPAAYGGMGMFANEGFDQAGFGEAGFDQPGFGQPGFDEGFGQPGFDQGAFEGDYAQTGYDQQQYYTDGQTYYDENGQPIQQLGTEPDGEAAADDEPGYTPEYYDPSTEEQEQQQQ